MIRRILTSFACCFLLSLLVTQVSAQEVQTDQEQSLLPDIDPQDIEIRSQFQARFPGLIRQPILGFNPKPRVFQIDPNRMPYFEDEEEIVANLPIGALDRPEAPQYQPLGYASPKNGFARFGVGSYTTPEADVYAITSLGDGHWLSGHLNHLSSNGHLDDRTSSFRDFNVGINSFSRLSDRTTLTMNAGVLSNFNHFPELETNVEELAGVNSRVSASGFNAGADLHIARTSLSGFRLAISGYSNGFDMESDATRFEGAASEWGFRTRGELSGLGNNIQEVFRARLNVQAGGIEPRGAGHHSWSVTTLSGHYERLFNYRTEVKAGFGFSGVSDARDDFILYLAPFFRLHHTFFDGLNVWGQLSGTPNHPSLRFAQAENRFLDLTSSFRHQYEAEVAGGVEIEPFTGTKFEGRLSYQKIRNYLYYFRQSHRGIDAGYYQAGFKTASIYRLSGGFSQDLKPDVLWIRGDLYWQRPRFWDDEKVPFAESTGLKATLSYRPSRRLLLEGWSEFLGGREDFRGESLSSYMLIGGRFELSLTERAGIYGKLLNLLDEEYELWQGYPERGFQAFVGVTLLF